MIIESSLAEVSPGLLAQIRSLHDEAWPAQPAEAQDRPIHDPELSPWSMVLVENGRVLACADILSKDLVHEGRSYRAAGISAVVTRVDARGRGHGLRLVTAAYERMASQGVDLGIFTCDAGLRGFYERAGWRHLAGTVVVGGTPDAPFPSDQPGFDKVTMGEFFSPAARANRESFIGARVALYPGTIDMLW